MRAAGQMVVVLYSVGVTVVTAVEQHSADVVVTVVVEDLEGGVLKPLQTPKIHMITIYKTAHTYYK